MAGEMELKKLSYKIHKCSGYLSNYVPENIMIDDPTDQSSRWSTNTNTPPQYLTIKLDKPAIVKTITFGKYNKTHVCNLKKFSVVGGMQDGHFSELLSGGLENNNVSETFSVRYTSPSGLQFPVQYISVLPQQAWGPSFNYCLWYLELRGVDDASSVRSALYNFNLQAEEETVRLCLKHLRQQRYSAAFTALQEETGVQLEAPALSCLYRLLVEEGNFQGAEVLLEKAWKEDLFEWYASRQPYSASWNNITASSPPPGTGDSSPSLSPSPPPLCPSPPNGAVPVRPGQRGGHQLCGDASARELYLFGGWDGEGDLSDLWRYSVQDHTWTLICRHSEALGGPTPRSCHKMVLDSGRRQIFTLGRYLDVKHRNAQNIKSDLYVFDIAEGSWLQVCEDTGVRGGPRLLFDHQMCVDSERRIIYVFGGKILSIFGESDDTVQYSGLYSYHIADDRWSLLLPDTAAALTNQHAILSRSSHSMLFHPGLNTLYVFGGQRHKEHLGDLLGVEVGGEGSPRVHTVCQAPPGRSPPPGFNHRATIDTQLKEIYVLAGLNKDDKTVSNSLWVFSLSRLEWSCVYKNDNHGQKYWSKMQHLEPCPRYAHQLVYEPMDRVHYLFGGNPGQVAQPSLRLDDFWALRLTRVSSEAAWKKARLCLRSLQYEELVRSERSAEALNFLQTSLHQATDHSSSQEARQFQLMATLLFSDKEQPLSFHPPLEARAGGPRRDPELPPLAPPAPLPPASAPLDACRRHERHHRRCELFQHLCHYFPQHMVQPERNLTDYTTL